MDFSSRLFHLRTLKYLQRHRPQLVTVAGGYQNLLTARAIELVLEHVASVRPARHDFADLNDLAAAILGVSSPTTFPQTLRQLVGSRLREVKVDPEPAIIIPIVKPVRPGQIDYLARQYPPHLVVLTNSASAHLDYFSDPSQQVHEQASVAIAADQDHGRVVLNIDDPLLADIRHHLKFQPLTISCHHQADVTCRRLLVSSPGHLTGFTGEVIVKGRPYEFHLPHLLSRIQIHSVLAALAVAVSYDLDIRQAILRLQNLRPPGGYLSLTKTSSGATLIDSHRENPPEYLEGVLHALRKRKSTRLILVLADLLPLSHLASRWYQALGQNAAFADLLITVGSDSKALQAAALLTRQGIDTHHFTHPAHAAKWIKTYISSRDTILLAGNSATNLNPLLSALHK